LPFRGWNFLRTDSRAPVEKHAHSEPEKNTPSATEVGHAHQFECPPGNNYTHIRRPHPERFSLGA
jgi:hypothetical protein